MIVKHETPTYFCFSFYTKVKLRLMIVYRADLTRVSIENLKKK